jgi:cellulose synthase/poly-beta-1,6-N-acetylglucosamine synthase-like glycosyltransferase
MNKLDGCRGSGAVAFALLMTIVASLIALGEIVGLMMRLAVQGDWWALAQYALFAIIVVFLIYGSLIYQVTRAAYWRRWREHQPEPLGRLRKIHRGDAPSLAVLVPAYKEEEDVVLQTLLSAALIEYPTKQVVLLIDDPPDPSSVEDRANLERMRGLPDRVRDLLRPPAMLFAHELQAFRAHGRIAEEVYWKDRLGSLFNIAAEHIERIGRTVVGNDHASAFFRHRIIEDVAHDLRSSAVQWQKASVKEASPAAIETELRRLTSYFSVDLSSFERKAWRNLSHAPNKAMNLNAYLDVMGKTMREARKADGSCDLVSCAALEARHTFPDADYVITLDADSLLLNDYALRLVDFLEQPQNARVGIAQTPYSSYPDAPGRLEHAAGITTDIQHIVHQGFTAYGSTYWVGANALIRKRALNDIAVTEHEDGKVVRKFIRDFTVIEDTESSVDLWLKGWSLHNYPARLAYSATPPDFGALLIQRRRWANGGLIILPKLLRFVFQRPLRVSRFRNGLVQAHYLVSLAASCSGVLILLLLAFEDDPSKWWLPLSAAPYFFLYGLDMRSLGHRWSDLLRVYALNLALIPVHLGGVFASLYQAVTGHKASFGRTPKVSARTAVPGIYVASVLGLCLYCLGNSVYDAFAARWAHAVFSLLNGLFLLYASVVFIGLRAAAEDLNAAVRRFRLPRRAVGGASPADAIAAGTSASVSAVAKLAFRERSPVEAQVAVGKRKYRR